MILIDTGAFYALIDKNDMNHIEAKRFYEGVVGRENLYTSLPILTGHGYLWMSVLEAILPIDFGCQHLREYSKFSDLREMT